jgi:proline dehydrogenase
MLDSMFSRFAWEHRFYPIVATDDPRMHRHAMEMARRNGWKPGEYEFHLIYGVQPRTVSALRAAGQRVRVTLPFGTSWWDYVMRCVAGQSPRLWLRARMAAATRA